MDKFPDVCNDGARSLGKARERIHADRTRTVFLLQTPGILIFWLSFTKNSKMIKRRDGEM